MNKKRAIKRKKSDVKHFVGRRCNFQQFQTFCRPTKCFE